MKVFVRDRFITYDATNILDVFQFQINSNAKAKWLGDMSRQSCDEGSNGFVVI